jgi:hypothetical protein
MKESILHYKSHSDCIIFNYTQSFARGKKLTHSKRHRIICTVGHLTVLQKKIYRFHCNRTRVWQIVTEYVLTQRFLFMLSGNGTEPVILVARTTHYTPTLLLCIDFSRINMGKLILIVHVSAALKPSFTVKENENMVYFSITNLVKIPAHKM